jgi:hypothetical protein
MHAVTLGGHGKLTAICDFDAIYDNEDLALAITSTVSVIDALR